MGSVRPSAQRRGKYQRADHSPSAAVCRRVPTTQLATVFAGPGGDLFHDGCFAECQTFDYCPLGVAALGNDGRISQRSRFRHLCLGKPAVDLLSARLAGLVRGRYPCQLVEGADGCPYFAANCRRDESGIFGGDWLLVVAAAALRR